MMMFIAKPLLSLHLLVLLLQYARGGVSASNRQISPDLDFQDHFSSKNEIMTNDHHHLDGNSLHSQQDSKTGIIIREPDRSSSNTTASTLSYGLPFKPTAGLMFQKKKSSNDANSSKFSRPLSMAATEPKFYFTNQNVLKEPCLGTASTVRCMKSSSNVSGSLERSINQALPKNIKKREHTSDPHQREHARYKSAKSGRRISRNAAGGPFFDPKSPEEVKVAIGTTAHVPCMVRNIGTKQVSWIRNRDLHVLTVGAFTFTTDDRFSAHRDTITKDWVLIIQHTDIQDSGLYECQVPTKPVTSHTVQLKVLVPRTELVGTSEVHLERGSSLNLTCLVHDSPSAPEFILWYHKDKLVNYSASSGSISSGRGSMGAEGGRVRVQTSHTKDTSRSSLLVSNATTRDSGRYHCEPSNAPKAVALVHVIPSEDPAAMQTTNSVDANEASGMLLLLTALLAIMLKSVLRVCRQCPPTQCRSWAQTYSIARHLQKIDSTHKHESPYFSGFTDTDLCCAKIVVDRKKSVDQAHRDDKFKTLSRPKVIFFENQRTAHVDRSMTVKMGTASTTLSSPSKFIIHELDSKVAHPQKYYMSVR
ncbi:uncharacterized protein LOC108672004 [Hyalella azteca]|uniref:Uncharacterized protein LOC108672004 n=1 Tax=Hyalella azteca TaxID=294128 RepID=A0A8B7NN47_HYAAZ|nr:uncharacterized protein LOC108672004 [Hyalella azteca]